MNEAADLQPDERAVLRVVRRLARARDGTVAGHDVRQQLLRAGFDKRTIAVAVQALVDRGFITRARHDDPDGSFYMTYRLERQD